MDYCTDKMAVNEATKEDKNPVPVSPGMETIKESTNEDVLPVTSNAGEITEGGSGSKDEEVVYLTDTSFNILIEVSASDKPLELNVSPLELVQEIHQRLMDMQETCHRTCFHLGFNGVTLDNFIELKTVEGLQEGSILKLIEEPYTQRKAKIHVRHIRDMINSLSQAEAFGGNDLTSPSFLTTLTGGDIVAASNIDASKYLQADSVDCTPPNHIMPGVKDIPLAAVLLKTEEQKKNLQALKTLTLSGWNPPPGQRKLRGDLMYLYITTLEDKTYHITASSRGFFVNCSSEEVFDPKPQGQLGKGSQTFHSLVDLLNNLSPMFKKNFAQIQRIRTGRNDLERVLTPYQVYSWLSPSIDHTLDAIRAEDASSFKLGYEEQIPGQIRDWNDELQSTKELPHVNLTQRILRERAVFKVHSDFVSAATRGAIAVVDGNVLALNPGEDFRSQMFIWNNIFFSLGFDVRDHYKEVGGDAAAHVAPINDLKGVQAYFNADVDGLYTLGTVVVDYRGYRVMAQSIIPGILEKEQDQSVVYGSIDSGKTVVTNDKYMELLGKAAAQLKIQPHSVLSAEDKPVELCSSIECKGIVGDDGRHYILDLMRTFPPDVNYLAQENIELAPELKELGFPKAQRHKLSSLRQELIENFVETKYLLFMKHAALQYHIMEKGDKENKDDKKPGDEKADADRKADIVKKAAHSVTSLKEDEFHIRFNADVFLEHIKLAPGESHEKEKALVVEASNFLVTTQLPSLVRDCVDHGTNILDGATLSTAFHNKGINMRYLGFFSSMVASDDRLSYLHRISITEMICRSAKHLFIFYMQSVDAHLTSQAVAHFLNCLLSPKLNANFVPSCVLGGANKGRNKNKRTKGSSSPTSVTSSCSPHTLDWTTITPKTLFDLLKKECESYFDFKLEGDCLDVCFSRYDVARMALLRSFASRTGIQLLQKNYHLNTGLSTGAFSEDDIVNMYPIVKHMEPRASDAFRFYITAQNKIQQGFLKEGFELIAEALQLMNQVYGPMHPEIVQCLRLLARLSYIMGDNETALMHQQRAVIMSERVNGFDSPHTIAEYGCLALYSFAVGQVSTTLKVLYRMRYLTLMVCGERHPDMATLDANIGLVLYALKQFELALNFLESSLKLYSQYYGEKSMKTALSYHLVARTQSCLGDFRGALKNEKETYAIYKAILGDNHEKTKESSECLRHLTQQAVVLQKQINDLSDSANMPKNAAKIMPPIHVTPPPMANILDLLNIINGIIFVQISPQEIEHLKAELERKAGGDDIEEVEKPKEIEGVQENTVVEEGTTVVEEVTVVEKESNGAGQQGAVEQACQ